PLTTHLIINKIDLPAAWDLHSLPGATLVSAKTAAGIAELCQIISRRLVPEAPSPGAALPFTPALCRQLQNAHDACANGDLSAAASTMSAVMTESICE